MGLFSDLNEKLKKTCEKSEVTLKRVHPITGKEVKQTVSLVDVPDDLDQLEEEIEAAEKMIETSTQPFQVGKGESLTAKVKVTKGEKAGLADKDQSGKQRGSKVVQFMRFMMEDED